MNVQTSGDVPTDGEMVDNLNSDIVDEILQSANDARYLQAISQLKILRELMDPDNELFCGDEEEKRLQRKLDEYKVEIQQIVDRAKKIKDTINLENSVGESDSEWIYGISYFGVTTYYKLSDDGCITVRMEGGLDNLPFFEQAAVIHDVDSFKNWVPFCEDSVLLEKLAPAELLLYISVNVPMTLTRDTCLHTYGADCLYENGKILLIGNSVDHEIGEEMPCCNCNGGEYTTEVNDIDTTATIDDNVNFRHTTYPKSSLYRGDGSVVEKVISHHSKTKCPWKSIGWGTDRMYIKEFTAIIDVTGPESARPVIIACIDPNMGRLVPQWALNFVIKNFAGVAVHVFQKQVQKIAKLHKLSPEERDKKVTGGTAGKMSHEKNRIFYAKWLIPKLRGYAKYKEWTISDIPILGVDGVMTEVEEGNKEVEIK
jgi:hypothetical protein